MKQSGISTNEPGGESELYRQFDNAYDQAGNVLTRTGPDNQDTTYTYDDLGRLETVSRNGMAVEYVYDHASRLTEVRYGSGTPVNKTFREYDEANRLTEIRHEDAASSVLHKITYAWNVNNTLASRVEYDYFAYPPTTNTVTFWYDARDRLIREERVTSGSPDVTAYDISYTYDQLGNRLSRVNNEDASIYTLYYYDSDPNNREPNYATNNNRLMKYEKYASNLLQRTVKYTYWKNGDVSNITVIDEGQDWRNDLALYYTTAGQLWLALWDRWKVDQDGDPTDYETIAAREFRYDTPRARYMSRPVDPDTFAADALSTWEWTEYDGDEAYNDYGASLSGNEPVAAETMRYAGGYGTFAQQAVSGSVISYLFGDLIRSTVMMTDEGGDPTGTTAYTAFGEHVSDYSAMETRYGYAGGWGYESGMLTLNGANEGLEPIRLQHVGARWYQPGIGRFVQRDPIGLGAGLNVYAYVGNDPVGNEGQSPIGNEGQSPMEMRDSHLFVWK